MSKKTTLKLSALATAISLACGGIALAGEATDTDREIPTMQPDVQLEQSMDNMQREENTEADWSESTVSEQQTDDHGMVATDGDAKEMLLDESTATENDLSEFVAAVEKAGLTGALTNGTSYTVFAPTDEALKSFTKDNSDISEEQLREILRSHIVAGSVNAAMISELDSAQVLTGNTVTISAEEENVEIAEATIVTADIQSGNLTIHTIDAVIEPSATTAASIEEDEEQEEAE